MLFPAPRADILRKYENRRAAYVDAVWTVINWSEAEVRYKSTRDEVFKAIGIDTKKL